jgi:superoxide dismutase, Fe-Mn family
MKRSKFLLSIAAIPIAAGFNPISNSLNEIINNNERSKKIMSKFELPALPYSYDALEPYIDKLTMEIHHDKHHAAYVANFNKAVEGTAAEGKTFDEIFKDISKYTMGVRNNGGGVYNHSMFWKVMKKNGGGVPTGPVAEAIKSSFGSFDDFKIAFNTAATTRFGSGWAWLIVNGGKLSVISTPNQDNPLMDIAEAKGTPVLLLDVWEHAYYLKYQNRRPEYVANFWNVVNWDEVNKLYSMAK